MAFIKDIDQFILIISKLIIDPSISPVFSNNPNEFLIRENQAKSAQKNMNTDTLNHISIDTSQDYYPSKPSSHPYRGDQNQNYQNWEMNRYKKYDNHVNLFLKFIHFSKQNILKKATPQI